MKLPSRAYGHCWKLFVALILVTWITVLPIMWHVQEPKLPDAPKLNTTPSTHTLPSPLTLFKPRTTPLPGPIVHYTDADDVFPAREGEKNVSFEMYLDCLAERLNVDRRARVERAFHTLETTFPYMVVMATVELGDIRAFMCNLDVHVQRLMYVQNGPVSTTTRFFDDVQRAFDFTSRLQIVRYIDNAGFGGAVNTAMRDAMQYTFDEVPFLHISNNDVRFTPGALAEILPKFYALTRGDKVKMEELAAEVATEPNQYTPAKFRSPQLRATSRDTLLQTSRLLPDRIRYMPPDEMMKAFANYTAAMYLGTKLTPSSWSVSRLAMETVGLMDENNYPAYFEDSDWIFRQHALGFRDFTPSTMLMKHFGQVSRKHAWENQHRIVTESIAYSKAIIVVVVEMYGPYGNFKWCAWCRSPTGEQLPRWKSVYANSTHRLPVDSWVFDVELHQRVSLRIRRLYESFLPGGGAQPPLDWLPYASFDRLLQSWRDNSAYRRRY